MRKFRKRRPNSNVEKKKRTTTWQKRKKDKKAKDKHKFSNITKRKTINYINGLVSVFYTTWVIRIVIVESVNCSYSKDSNAYPFFISFESHCGIT